MAKQKQAKQQVSGLQRLGMRVSAMINSPLAQLNRRVTIHRLDTDSDEAWDGVMELLGEEDGIDMTFNDGGTVTLRWAAIAEEGAEAPVEELAPVDEMVVQNLAEAPF